MIMNMTIEVMINVPSTKLAMEILDEKSKQDPYFAKVWASQKAYLEKFKPYSSLTSFDD